MDQHSDGGGSKDKRKAPAGGLTMEALAEVLGVSKITVSRALRNSPLVTPETTERVKAVAEQMGYRMNSSARNLRLQRHHTVAVLLEMQPDADRPMSEPYPLHLLGGLTEALTSRGYSVLLVAMHALATGMSVAADGMILLGQGAHDDAVRKAAQMGLPLVVWGAEHHGGSGVVVGSDNRQGGACVAERFNTLGCQRVAFIGDAAHAEIEARLEGFRAALAPGVDLVHLPPEAFTFGAGLKTLQAHLATCGDAWPQGVFAANDLLAMGAVRALLDAGLQVPTQVSVVGYDNSPSAASFAPPLSSVNQDWRRGGKLLATKVLALIEGEPASHEIMPAELVLRDT